MQTANITTSISIPHAMIYFIDNDQHTLWFVAQKDNKIAHIATIECDEDNGGSTFYAEVVESPDPALQDSINQQLTQSSIPNDVPKSMANWMTILIEHGFRCVIPIGLDSNSQYTEEHYNLILNGTITGTNSISNIETLMGAPVQNNLLTFSLSL
jgi:hypothetical protein